MARASSNGKPRMRATLIRFGPELFEELQEEAARSGVSVAQYVREAVVARMAYTAGRRGDPGYETDGTRKQAQRTRARSRELRTESEAVVAQSKQAVHHAHERGHTSPR